MLSAEKISLDEGDRRLSERLSMMKRRGPSIDR